MNDIFCPHCKKAFKVDESGYADILKQVRDSDFNKQLQERLKLADKEKLDAVELAKEKTINEMRESVTKKEMEISNLKAQIDGSEMKEKLAINEALKEIEKERDGFRNELKEVELKRELAENALKEKYETQIKDRDDAIERLKDMKARLSTKMVGETLELHCENEFNRIRLRLFPTLTLLKTMMPAVEAKVTIFLGIRMKRELKSFRLCSK